VLRERMPLSVKPIALDADGLNDQRVTLPPASVVPQECPWRY